MIQSNFENYTTDYPYPVLWIKRKFDKTDFEIRTLKGYPQERGNRFQYFFKNKWAFDYFELMLGMTKWQFYNVYGKI